MASCSLPLQVSRARRLALVLQRILLQPRWRLSYPAHSPLCRLPSPFLPASRLLLVLRWIFLLLRGRHHCPAVQLSEWCRWFCPPAASRWSSGAKLLAAVLPPPPLCPRSLSTAAAPSFAHQSPPAGPLVTLLMDAPVALQPPSGARSLGRCTSRDRSSPGLPCHHATMPPTIFKNGQNGVFGS